MHNLFAGFMGFFIGIGAMFHGGHAVLPKNTNPVNATANASTSGTISQGDGNFRGMRNGRGKTALTQGERPFFGIVTTVNGSTITIQMMMRMRQRETTVTPSISPSTAKTLTVTLDSSTTYTGGAQTDIAVNTKIAGVGKSNTDGSITAVKVQINPTVPSGFPRRDQDQK